MSQQFKHFIQFFLCGVRSFLSNTRVCYALGGFFFRGFRPHGNDLNIHRRLGARQLLGERIHSPRHRIEKQTLQGTVFIHRRNEADLFALDLRNTPLQLRKLHLLHSPQLSLHGENAL